MAVSPHLASDGGKLYLAWVDESATTVADPNAAIYVKTWDGANFVEQLTGDASGGGISVTGGTLDDLSLAVDSSGRPTVAWMGMTSGLPQIYLRGVTQQANRVFYATPTTGIQSILDNNDLGAGDVILLAPGNYTGFELGANESGVLILGAQGDSSAIIGQVIVDAGVGGTFQRLQLDGGLVENGSNGLAIVDCQIGAELTLTGGTNLQILHDSFTGTGEGIRLAAASQGLIAYNDIGAMTTGIDLAFPFDGAIMDNTIHGAADRRTLRCSGPPFRQYDREQYNRREYNCLGQRRLRLCGRLSLCRVSRKAASRTRFATIPPASSSTTQMCRVSGSTAIPRASPAQGTVGGSDFEHANLIESNITGVYVTGTVQFSRIAENNVGIQATSGEIIEHDMIYRNTQEGVLVAGVSSVHIVNNTFYAALGDNIRIQGGARDVEVLNNVLWADSGYDIYVANDSQSGFFSDYNDLYAGDKGILVYWTQDFTDILDWQDDVAAFDLHSIGRTVVNPLWAEPRFYNLARNDFRIFPEVAGQRFSSPTEDAGDPITDEGQPSTYTNLLVNGDFESGLPAGPCRGAPRSAPVIPPLSRAPAISTGVAPTRPTPSKQ